MTQHNDRIGKTFIVVGGLCLACSILVASAAVGLRPWQEQAKARDRQANILRVAGLPTDDISRVYQQRIDARLLDLATGQYVEGDANQFDMLRAAKDPAMSELIPETLDVAGIRRRARWMPVYLAKNVEGQIDSVILPVYGQGLWSTMYGFVSLAADGRTVKGLTYYEQGETPGLGSEIENPRWLALWIGKQMYDDEGQFALRIIKGQAQMNHPYQVDGLSGATLTSQGVQHSFDYWMGPHAYGPFLSNLKNGDGSHG